MLSNISWADYIIAVVIFVTIYYLFIGLRFYWTELKELLSGKRRLFFKSTAQSVDAFDYPSNFMTNPSIPVETELDDELVNVENLIERLKSVISNTAGKEIVVDELKGYLSLVLLEFPSLKNSLLRSSINELIVSECEKYSTVKLSESEVDLLW